MKIRVPPALRLDWTTMRRPTARDRWIVILGLLGFAALLVLSLLLPDRTYSGQHSNDLMVWLDAAYRAAIGQVPSRDFATPFGPLTYVLLGWAYHLSGSVGAVMPTNTALYTVVFLPLLFYACLTRLSWPVALLFGAHLLILVVSPAYIGDNLAIPTFAMFYNRFGWALLSLLIVLALPRRGRPGSEALDALMMAALWALMFYTKISFAAVATVVIFSFMMFAHLRRATVGALVLVAVTLGVAELFWGYTAAYLHDVGIAAAVSGSVQGGLVGVGWTTLRNATGLELFVGVLIVALLRGVPLNYLLLALLAGGTGVFVANQNAQGPGIPPLTAAALVVLLAPRTDQSVDRGLLELGLLLTFGLTAPGDLFQLAVHADHVVMASKPEVAPGRVSVDGLVAPLGYLATDNSRKAETTCAPYEALYRDPKLIGDIPAPTPGQYLATVNEGVQLLSTDRMLSGSVTTLDFGNPFNALLHRPPVVGGNQWSQAGRNVSELNHLKADQALGDAQVVMVPRRPSQPETESLMLKLYGSYLATHFDLAGRSPCWQAYRRHNS